VIGEISHTLRKFIVGTLRLLLTVWVISLLLTASIYVIVTKVFGSRSTQLVGRAPINVGFGILILGLTIKLHWPIQSTDEETKDRNGRVTLTLKKAIVATLRFLIPVWAISFLSQSVGRRYRGERFHSYWHPVDRWNTSRRNSWEYSSGTHSQVAMAHLANRRRNEMVEIVVQQFGIVYPVDGYSIVFAT